MVYQFLSSSLALSVAALTLTLSSLLRCKSIFLVYLCSLYLITVLNKVAYVDKAKGAKYDCASAHII